MHLFNKRFDRNCSIEYYLKRIKFAHLIRAMNNTSIQMFTLRYQEIAIKRYSKLFCAINPSTKKHVISFKSKDEGYP